MPIFILTLDIGRTNIYNGTYCLLNLKTGLKLNIFCSYILIFLFKREVFITIKIFWIKGAIKKNSKPSTTTLLYIFIWDFSSLLVINENTEKLTWDLFRPLMSLLLGSTGGLSRPTKAMNASCVVNTLFAMSSHCSATGLSTSPTNTLSRSYSQKWLLISSSASCQTNIWHWGFW